MTILQWVLMHGYGLRTPHLHNVTAAVQQGLG